MALQEYRRKRRFARTPEPAGRKVRNDRAQRFVVQNHAARRLHYDFRLEIDGVLKSWAVPKGPCLDPGEKRLAAHVEDHPIEYRDFEGIIPQGEYGGGTVVVWDQGTWDADHDLAEEYRQGHMKFRLHGEKLTGGWNLVRMRARKPGADDWLLIKERDDTARPLSEFDVVQAEPNSVLTGRTLEEIARQADRVWHSNRADTVAAKNRRPPTAAAKNRPDRAAAKKRSTTAASKKKRARRKIWPQHVKGAKRAKLPSRIEPQLAASRVRPPDSAGWLNEIEFDGYRMLCHIEKGKASLITKRRLDWTDRFGELAAALANLPAESAWLDGEVVCLRPDGTSDFEALERACREKQTSQATYCAFDLLYLDGFDLRSAPLSDRKGLLADLLKGQGARVQYVDHIEGSGEEFYRQCCRMGLAGIVSKRGERPYKAGRDGDWIKVKCKERENTDAGGSPSPAPKTARKRKR